MKLRENHFWLPLLWCLALDFSLALQIPCLREFDRACNLVRYSYCDTDLKQCECLPRFTEKENHCIPELDAFCDKPGVGCADLANSVCSPTYRCICETGYENVNDECVLSPDSVIASLTNQPLNDKSYQAHRPPQNNDLNDLQWNPDILKDQSLRNELIRRILQNSQLRALLIQNLLSQRGGSGGVNSVVTNPEFPKSGKNQNSLQISNSIPTSTVVGLSQACQSTAQCSVVVPHSVCYRGSCSCAPNYVENNGKCFPGLGKPCSAAQPCFVRYSVCGEKSVCECQSGLRNQGGRCVPGVGSECMLRGQPCFGVANSLCNDRDMCVCLAGFEESDGICKKSTLQPRPGTRCSTDCGALSHSYCNATGHCACLPGYIEQNGHCKRIGRPGAACYSSSDCTAQDANTWCRQRQCVCVHGYVLVLGKCYPSLGSRCSLAMPCGIANSYCSPLGICQCKDNSIQRSDKCMHLRKLFDQALAMGESKSPSAIKECAIVGSPCIGKPNTICNVDLNCICQIGFIDTPSGCVQESLAHKRPLHGLPWLKQPQVAVVHQPAQPQRLVLEETSCTDVGRPCVGIQNSLCTWDGICICVPGHVKTSSGCRSTENVIRLTQPTLDTAADSPTLTCASEFVDQKYESCVMKCFIACSSACDADVNAVCTPLGICTCKQGYKRVQNKCFPILGTVCSKEDWCGTPNSHCDPSGTCSCMTGYMQHRNQCRLLADIDSALERKLECWIPGKPCKAVPNAVCNSTYQCECNADYQRNDDGLCVGFTSDRLKLVQNSRRCLDGFVEVNGHCLPAVLLGYSCHDSKQCAEVTPGSTCQHGKCACTRGFITYNATSCLPVGPLGSPCTVFEECGTPGSICIDGACRCKPSYIPLLGLCFAGLGQDCNDLSKSASKKCGVKNSVCAEETCRCRHIQLHDICL